MVTSQKVTRYNTAGFIEDLPDLNQGRDSHGCGAYRRQDGAKVRDSLQTKAEHCFVLLFLSKLNWLLCITEIWYFILGDCCQQKKWCSLLININMITFYIFLGAKKSYYLRSLEILKVLKYHINLFVTVTLDMCECCLICNYKANTSSAYPYNSQQYSALLTIIITGILSSRRIWCW